MERVLSDATLVRSTYYYGFYTLEALRKAGLADRYIEQLAPWQQMLALGLTTTAESPEPTRSDSHAWSAHPNYGLLATVLGIRPDTPGFRSVRIAPSLGPLQKAEGRLPHPLGDIDVRLERSGDQGLRGEVTLPPGLGGVFEWKGRKMRAAARPAGDRPVGDMRALPSDARRWLRAALATAMGTILTAGSVAGQASTGHGAARDRSSGFPRSTGRVFLSGRVVLEDGTPPPEQVLVQRACDGRAIPQGYTDAEGPVQLRAGSQSGGWRSMPRTRSSKPPSRQRDLTGCELRVQLPGFYPAARDLSGRRVLDSPDVGTLVLRRLPGVQGSIFSPTTLQARKDARAAFEKGRALGRDKKLDEARKEYEKAIRIAPGFAAAWYRAGPRASDAQPPADARKAYGEALLADPRFIKPYRQIAFLSFNEQKWPEVVETTDRWTSLDPVSYPEAYFFNAFANFYLNRLDAAERSAREVVKLDSDAVDPQGALRARRGPHREEGLRGRRRAASHVRRDRRAGPRRRAGEADAGPARREAGRSRAAPRVALSAEGA